MYSVYAITGEEYNSGNIYIPNIKIKYISLILISFINILNIIDIIKNGIHILNLIDLLIIKNDIIDIDITKSINILIFKYNILELFNRKNILIIIILIIDGLIFLKNLFIAVDIILDIATKIIGVLKGINK